MRLKVHTTPETTIEVEAESTEHPELAIHELVVREPGSGHPVGTAWAVSHIETGEVILRGLLTRDLALATARWILSIEPEIGPGFAQTYPIGCYQAAASLMTDLHFTTVNFAEIPHLVVA